MDHSGLLCATQSWNGPKGSTFSPDWTQALTFLSPDIIAPPPAASDQPMAGVHPPQAAVFVPASHPSAPKATPKGPDQNPGGPAVMRERRSRPVSAVDPQRRSQSLCTSTATVAEGAGEVPTLRRRCESYAMAYPSSSSDDSGSDSASNRKGEALLLRLPDAVPRPRARSIVLRKPKRRPPPPARTVSLGKPGERRCQSLYIPRDLLQTALLPDLIPLAQSDDSADPSAMTTDTSGSGVPAAKPNGQVPLPPPPPPSSTPLSRPLGQLRSSEPCARLTGASGQVPAPDPSLVQAPGGVAMDTAKTPSSSDSLNSPSSTRSSPLQPPATSPSRPPASISPSSSGYSSQCDTPTGSVRTATIFGPSPMGCRMRPKPAGQKSRGNRVRLSLQLPETTSVAEPQAPAADDDATSAGGLAEDPTGKTCRRYSDSSATARPKQRCLSMLLPMVTQEDLLNVRLRSVSSAEDIEAGLRYEGCLTEAIAEEVERDTPTPSIESPKNRPPVAPKPAGGPTWQPQPQPSVNTAEDQQGAHEQPAPSSAEKRRAPIPKPKRSALSLSGGTGGGGGSGGEGLVSQQSSAGSRVLTSSVSETQLYPSGGHPALGHGANPIEPQGHSPAIAHSNDTHAFQAHERNPALEHGTETHPCEGQDRRRVAPPPVAKKPEVLILPNGHGIGLKEGGNMGHPHTHAHPQMQPQPQHQEHPHVHPPKHHPHPQMPQPESHPHPLMHPSQPHPHPQMHPPQPHPHPQIHPSQPHMHPQMHPHPQAHAHPLQSHPHPQMHPPHPHAHPQMYLPPSHPHPQGQPSQAHAHPQMYAPHPHPHAHAHAPQDVRLMNGGNVAMHQYVTSGLAHGKYNTMVARGPSYDRHPCGYPEPTMSQGYSETPDEVLGGKTSSRTTEDLFTIIHRSKRKLLGRKDSFEGRPSDLGMQTLAGVTRGSSQNDSFMALLRRTRSAKAAPGGRISAAELLKSSKPPAGHTAHITRP